MQEGFVKSMEQNNLCAQYCVDVIRAVMQKSQVPRIPQSIALEQIYSFAKLHNVEALLYYGLCELEPDPSHPVWQAWGNRVAMLLAQGIVQLADRDELFSVLTGAGIPLLPFKGCWLKEQYPNMEYRQMSDLDMLIPPEKAAEAKKIMLSLGYHGESVENALNHAGYLKPPYTEVELHVSLLEDGGEYYNNVWNRVRKVEGYPCLYRFSPEDEYIFYLVHMNKHLEDAGTGIRSVLDSVVYRNVYPDMDRDYLKRELTKLGLWERTLQIESLADCWFTTGEAVPSELTELAKSIFSAGSYGTVENRSRNRLDKLQQKYKNPLLRGIIYWILRICRPLQEMQLSYPVLNKLPVLLPLFWICRAVMIFARHPKKIWHHVVLVFKKGKKHG